ncbi:hypothetical protein ACFX1Q_046534 [Malus domestica]
MTVGELMRIQMGISEVLDDDDFVIVGDVDIGEAKAKDDAELNGEKDVGEKKLKRSSKAGEEDGATVNHKKDGLSLKEKKKDGTRKKADDSSARGE